MININNCMWGRSCWFDILCQKQRDNPQPLLGNAIGEIPLRDAEATSSRYPSEIPLLIFGIKGLSKDRAWESGDAALTVLLCYKGQKFRHNLGVTFTPGYCNFTLHVLCATAVSRHASCQTQEEKGTTSLWFYLHSAWTCELHLQWSWPLWDSGTRMIYLWELGHIK